VVQRRLIIGNLDAEVDFAREDRRERGERAEPRLDLPHAVLDHISAAATLLRVYAKDSDVLWTPRPVDEKRVSDVPGLGRPELRSGPLEDLPSAVGLRAWAVTRAVDKLVAEPSLEYLEPCVSPKHANAARIVNDRAFCLEAATRIGCALPGTTMIDDVATLERHLAAGGASASCEDRWVVKARFSAAGRARLIGRGGNLDDLERRRAEKLLSIHGPLLFEPWMERVADYGCCVLVSNEVPRIYEPHRLEVDRLGGFVGLTLPPSPFSKRKGDSPLSASAAAAESSGNTEFGGGSARSGEISAFSKRKGDCPLSVWKTLRGVVERVAELALAVGYCGPLEIDCWEFRGKSGSIDFHPLGEINARMSFGLVAHALREALGSRESELRLRFGDQKSAEATITLLEPDAEGRGGAWVELSS
jgi:hypothetical protein